MTEESESHLSELSTEVFEKFLATLEQLELPEEVRTRLRNTLLVDGKLTDTALRAAIFGDEAPQ